jgi:hypothetical protein
MRRLLLLPLLAVVLPLLGASCVAKTDRASYGPGDLGQTAFHNGSGATAWLDGCSAYHFERHDGRDWAWAGPAVVCVWEGFAQPVEPGESVAFDLIAPSEPGVYRLRYDVGVGCHPEAPLQPESCRAIGAVHTPEFRVVGLCEPSECGPQLGMPNRLCSDGSIGGPTGRCLEDPVTRRCGWEIASCPED